jgi:hypothetical protein
MAVLKETELQVELDGEGAVELSLWFCFGVSYFICDLLFVVPTVWEQNEII